MQIFSAALQRFIRRSETGFPEVDMPLTNPPSSQALCALVGRNNG